MLYEKVKLYKEREDVTLTTYILDDSVELHNGRKRGAVLICPGGANLYCSDREGEPIAMAFGALGYHTFVLRYSVYNENEGVNTMDHIIPDMSKPWVEKDCKFPRQIQDIGKALLYIKERSDEWLIDMEKIALCGFSAGAHNCAMYSVYYNKPIITDFLGIDVDGIRPAAAILGYMLSDYVELLENTDPANELFSCSMRAYVGEPGKITVEQAAQVSPCRLVNESTPPMFLWATAGDNLVDPIHTIKMAEALCRNHIPYEVHMFEEGKHGMCLGTQATASVKDELDENVEKWFYLADKWLKKRIGMTIDTIEKEAGF